VGRVSGTFGTVFFGGGGASTDGMLEVRTNGSAKPKTYLTALSQQCISEAENTREKNNPKD